jgi:hypothetical protein
MLRELNMERQRAVAARERALREGKLIDSSWTSTTAVAIAAASVTVTVPDPTVKLGKLTIPEASRIFEMSAPMLRGALFGALPSIAVGLAAAYCASPYERANVWKEAVGNIVKGMGLGGMAGYLMDKISRALLELGSKLFDTALARFYCEGREGKSGCQEACVLVLLLMLEQLPTGICRLHHDCLRLPRHLLVLPPDMLSLGQKKRRYRDDRH